MANNGKRVYHGRRASPIVWLIALAVLIAAVVLVIVGVSKKEKPDPDPDPVTDVQTPDDGGSRRHGRPQHHRRSR